MTHDELAISLANHLSHPRRMLWTDVPIGPAGSPRPDVYALQKSFIKPSPTVYEIKISVSDFRADVTAGKYLRYLEFAEAVVFATPAGLISASDIPKACGWMAYNAETSMWTTRRRPTRAACTLPQEALLKLMMYADQQHNPAKHMRSRSAWLDAAKARKRWGDRVARVIADVDYWERQVEEQKQRSESMVQDARSAAAKIRKEAAEAGSEALKTVCEALGIDPGERGALQYAVSERLKLLDRDEEIRRLRLSLMHVRSTLDKHDEELDAFEQTLGYRRSRRRTAA